MDTLRDACGVPAVTIAAVGRKNPKRICARYARSVGMISSPSPTAAPEVRYKTTVGSNTELLNSQKR